jgi:hypothetical protein
MGDDEDCIEELELTRSCLKKRLGRHDCDAGGSIEFVNCMRRVDVVRGSFLFRDW